MGENDEEEEDEDIDVLNGINGNNGHHLEETKNDKEVEDDDDDNFDNFDFEDIEIQKDINKAIEYVQNIDGNGQNINDNQEWDDGPIGSHYYPSSKSLKPEINGNNNDNNHINNNGYLQHYDDIQSEEND